MNFRDFLVRAQHSTHTLRGCPRCVFPVKVHTLLQQKKSRLIRFFFHSVFFSLLLLLDLTEYLKHAHRSIIIDTNSPFQVWERHARHAFHTGLYFSCSAQYHDNELMSWITWQKQKYRKIESIQIKELIWSF